MLSRERDPNLAADLVQDIEGDDRVGERPERGLEAAVGDAAGDLGGLEVEGVMGGPGAR